MDLFTPEWVWLAPEGDRLLALEPSGTLTQIRLDGTRALRDAVVCW
jgi:hypothetical protein